MSSIHHVSAVQPLNLQPSDFQLHNLLPRDLPPGVVPSPRLPIVGRLLSRLRHLFRRDEPGTAVLRDLGIGQASTRCASHFPDIYGGFESSRMRFLDASQGWRGS